MKKVTKVISAAVIAAALTATMVAGASAEKAGVTFQTANWIFRNTLFQSNVLVPDEDYYADTGEEPFIEANGYFYKLDGTFNDVEITGDGSYTVSVKGHSMETKSGDSAVGYNMVKLATNIDPTKYPDLKITIDKVTIAGQELTPTTSEFTGENLPTEPFASNDSFMDQDVDSPSAPVTISMINIWGDTIVDAALIDANGDISIDFTVEGMGAAAAEEPAASEEPADTDAPATDAPATDAPTTGDSSKPSTNTGAEGIALAAGVAVLATGAAIVAKKRK